MIRRARQEDLADILRIYETARAFMKRSGNERQWGEDYPPADLLQADLQSGQLYVVIAVDVIHGVFAFLAGEDATYRRIEDGAWKNNAPYCTIHRVASDGRSKGIFEACTDFCKTRSRNIRIDTHHDNLTMQRLIERSGFDRCGIIHVEDGSPRIAYQYTAFL